MEAGPDKGMQKSELGHEGRRTDNSDVPTLDSVKKYEKREVIGINANLFALASRWLFVSLNTSPYVPLLCVLSTPFYLGCALHLTDVNATQSHDVLGGVAGGARMVSRYMTSLLSRRPGGLDRLPNQCF